VKGAINRLTMLLSHSTVETLEKGVVSVRLNERNLRRTVIDKPLITDEWAEEIIKFEKEGKTSCPVDWMPEIEQVCASADLLANQIIGWVKEPDEEDLEIG